jgi:hypothetical protein
MSSRVFNNSTKVYLKLDSVVDTITLQSIYDTLMAECWSDMSVILEKNAYIHCYLYYRPEYANVNEKLLRKIYNGVRGFDDPTDQHTYLEKYMTVKEYNTGWMVTVYAGPENCRSGDGSFQNIYKFIPKLKSLKPYEKLISKIKEQVDKECDAHLNNLMFSMLPPGSKIDWHIDNDMVGRYHIVVKNDMITPSMTFKKDGNSKLEHIPAKIGETYFANVNIPHTVPISTQTRLHLLGCCHQKTTTFASLRTKAKLGNIKRHQCMEDDIKLTWAEWKKNLNV